MSLYDFRRAVALFDADEPFYAFVMAAMIKADTTNLRRLQLAFPETWQELDMRYNASLGGALPGEEPGDVVIETSLEAVAAEKESAVRKFKDRPAAPDYEDDIPF